MITGPLLIVVFLLSVVVLLVTILKFKLNAVVALLLTAIATTATSSILVTTIVTSGVSPILCAIAICAGGMGLSLPNDSGFWAISRFFKISVGDTIRAWTIPGFISGITVLIVASILSLFQNILPGLM